jgi:hypothetical protein
MATSGCHLLLYYMIISGLLRAWRQLTHCLLPLLSPTPNREFDMSRTTFIQCQRLCGDVCPLPVIAAARVGTDRSRGPNRHVLRRQPQQHFLAQARQNAQTARAARQSLESAQHADARRRRGAYVGARVVRADSVWKPSDPCVLSARHSKLERSA